MNDDDNFYRAWNAILYPLQFSENNVSQVLEMQPSTSSNAGTFTLHCQSDQSGYYSSKVNLTLKITEIDNNEGIVSLFPVWNSKKSQTFNLDSRREKISNNFFSGKCFIFLIILSRI